MAERKLISTKRAKNASALRVWEPALRVGYVIVVAVFVALIAGRVNRGQAVEMGGTEPAIEPLLLQPVKPADVNMQSIQWAVQSLNKASPVRVELDAESFAGEIEATGDGPPPRPLRLKDQNVAEAVAAILARFDRPDRPLTYIVENGWVILGRADRLAAREPSVVRAYEVGDLLEKEDAAHANDRLVASSERVQGRARDFTRDGRFESLIFSLVDPLGYMSEDSKQHQLRSVRVAQRWLIIEGTARAQREVQRVLFILRHGEVVRGSSATRPTTTGAATQP